MLGTSGSLLTAAPVNGAPDTVQVQNVQGGKTSLFLLARSVEKHMNAAVAGRADQLGMARKVIAEFGRHLGQVDAADLKDARNRYALVDYLQLGGSPALVRRLLERLQIAVDADPVLQGSLLFAERRIEEAAAVLETIEPRTFNRRIAARVALVRGMVLASRDKTRALSFLDEARLLSPGTVIEEASLRQAVQMLHDADTSMALVRALTVYLRRFPDSPYAGRVVPFAIRAAVSGPLVADQDGLERVLVAMDQLSVDKRDYVKLRLARHGVAAGRSELVEIATNSLLSSADVTPVVRARGELYRLVMGAVQRPVDATLSALMGLDTDGLGAEDIALRDAGFAVLRAIADTSPQPDAVNATADVVRDDGEANNVSNEQEIGVVPPTLDDMDNEMIREGVARGNRLLALYRSGG